MVTLTGHQIRRTPVCDRTSRFVRSSRTFRISAVRHAVGSCTECDRSSWESFVFAMNRKRNWIVLDLWNSLHVHCRPDNLHLTDSGLSSRKIM